MGTSQPAELSFVDGIVKGGSSAATLVPNPVGEGPYFVFNDPYATVTGRVYMKEMTVHYPWLTWYRFDPTVITDVTTYWGRGSLVRAPEGDNAYPHLIIFRCNRSDGGGGPTDLQHEMAYDTIQRKWVDKGSKSPGTVTQTGNTVVALDNALVLFRFTNPYYSKITYGADNIKAHLTADMGSKLTALYDGKLGTATHTWPADYFTFADWGVNTPLFTLTLSEAAHSIRLDFSRQTITFPGGFFVAISENGKDLFASNTIDEDQVPWIVNNWIREWDLHPSDPRTYVMRKSLASGMGSSVLNGLGLSPTCLSGCQVTVVTDKVSAILASPLFDTASTPASYLVYEASGYGFKNTLAIGEDVMRLDCPIPLTSITVTTYAAYYMQGYDVVENGADGVNTTLASATGADIKTTETPFKHQMLLVLGLTESP
jgi:hypothetical protein